MTQPALEDLAARLLVAMVGSSDNAIDLADACRMSERAFIIAEAFNEVSEQRKRPPMRFKRA
jgi:hypothetical protein